MSREPSSLLDVYNFFLSSFHIFAVCVNRISEGGFVSSFSTVYHYSSLYPVASPLILSISLHFINLHDFNLMNIFRILYCNEEWEYQLISSQTTKGKMRSQEILKNIYANEEIAIFLTYCRLKNTYF